MAGPTTADTTQLTADSTQTIEGAEFGSCTIVGLNQAGLGFITPRPAYLSGSACAFECSFYDVNGDPMEPNDLQYEIYDLVSGEQILAPATIENAGASVTIVVLPADNAMVSLSRCRETHSLTLLITDGQGILYRRRALFDIVRAQ